MVDNHEYYTQAVTGDMFQTSRVVPQDGPIYHHLRWHRLLWFPTYGQHDWILRTLSQGHRLQNALTTITQSWSEDGANRPTGWGQRWGFSPHNTVLRITSMGQWHPSSNRGSWRALKTTSSTRLSCNIALKILFTSLLVIPKNKVSRSRSSSPKHPTESQLQHYRSNIKCTHQTGTMLLLWALWKAFRDT